MVNNQPDTAVWKAGFLLSQEWQDGAHGCICTFWGRNDDGPFVLQVGVRPVCFISRNVALPPDVPVAERREVNLLAFNRKPVDALYFARQRDLRITRDILTAAGVQVYESDLQPDERHLMERFIYGSCEYDGVSRIDSNGVAVCINPRMRSADYIPKLSMLSFDIETGSARQLYSIAYHFTADGKTERGVFMARKGHKRNDPPTQFCGDEASVLKEFFETVRRLDPDIISGWNILDFDLPFLQTVCDRNNLNMMLGRRGMPARFNLNENSSRWRIQIPGRVIIDGIPALRGSFIIFSSYALDAVAHQLLGEGKNVDFSGRDKQREIDRLFNEDAITLASYNLHDAELVTRIFEKCELIPLLISRSRISGMLMEHIGRSVAAFDYGFLPRLHRKGFVAPDRRNVEDFQPQSGGLVLPSIAGLHSRVAAFDFRSLYPSIIRTFNICPLALLMSDVEPVSTPTGAKFSSKEQILPEYVAGLMEARKKAQAEKNRELSQAIKILMNSFYGVMGTAASRFYDPVLPSAITGTGQWILRTTRAIFESKGYQVLYGDTDSLFVCLKEAESATPHEVSIKLAATITEEIAEMLSRQYRVESKLQLTFVRYYKAFYLPSGRAIAPARSGFAEETDGEPSSKEGAAKRYAGLVIHPDDKEELQITGLESVRSDWTPLARRAQQELLWRVFHNEASEEWIRSLVDDLYGGRCDDELIYSRRLRKAPEAYVKQIPPHVKAALLLSYEQRREGGNVINYVMTRRGPMPVQLPHDDLDYEHYAVKQLKPVVEELLSLTGIRVAAILKGEEQLELFG